MIKKTFTVTGSNGKKHTATTLVPSLTAAVGTNKKYTALSAQFKARYLSGSGNSLAVGTGKKLSTALKHFDKYMTTREGITNGDTIKKEHVDRYITHLCTKPSLLTGKQLVDKSIKDILSGARTILMCYGKGHMMNQTYEAHGLAVSHSALEKPIEFTKFYLQDRGEYQLKLEACRNITYAVQSQLGQAFGLREAERVESRDIVVTIDGNLHATRGAGKLEAVTERQIAKRYGRTAVDRLERVYANSGIPHLIVEHAKGNRNRFLPIDNEVRRTAVERVREHIQTNPNHQVWRKTYPDGTTTQQAERNYTRMQERCGATRENQLSSHCDRHFEAQRLYRDAIEKGMAHKEAAYEIVDQMGHGDPSKVYYYIERNRLRP